MHQPSLFRSFCGLLLGFVIFASLGIWGSVLIPSAFKPDQLFEPGRFTPTPLFLGLQIGLGFFAALLAGWLIRRVALSRMPALLFAAIVLVLSGVHALFALTAGTAQPRPRVGDEPPEVVQTEMIAQQPAWFTVTQPILLAGGILLGSGRKARR